MPSRRTASGSTRSRATSARYPAPMPEMSGNQLARAIADSSPNTAAVSTRLKSRAGTLRRSAVIAQYLHPGDTYASGAPNDPSGAGFAKSKGRARTWTSTAAPNGIAMTRRSRHTAGKPTGRGYCNESVSRRSTRSATSPSIAASISRRCCWMARLGGAQRGSELLRRVHVRERTERRIHRAQLGLVDRQHPHLIEERDDPEAILGDRAGHLRDASLRIQGVERLVLPTDARDHDVRLADMREQKAPHLGRQERHVARRHEHRVVRRGGDAGRDPAERPARGVLVTDDAQAERRVARLVRHDDDLVGDLREHRRDALDERLAVELDPRFVLAHALALPAGHDRRRDAHSRGPMRARMKSAIAGASSRPQCRTAAPAGKS